VYLRPRFQHWRDGFDTGAASGVFRLLRQGSSSLMHPIQAEMHDHSNFIENKHNLETINRKCHRTKDKLQDLSSELVGDLNVETATHEKLASGQQHLVKETAPP